jgi:tetratricopeptide (TPR) repeat protein
VRGFLVERREGARISRLRIVMAAGLFTASSVIVAVEGFGGSAIDTSALAPPPGTYTPPAVAAQRAKLAQILQQIAQLEQQKQALEQDMTKAGAAPPPLQSGQGTPVVAIFLMTVLLLLLGALLLIGGQVHTLLPDFLRSGQGDPKERAELQLALQRMQSALWEKRYTDALDIGEGIPEKKLGPFYRLDLLYFRAYCIIQLYTGDVSEEVKHRREGMIAQAIADLQEVADEAPNRAEVTYALAVAHGIAGNYGEALELFDRVEPRCATTGCCLRLIRAFVCCGSPRSR